MEVLEVLAFIGGVLTAFYSTHQAVILLGRKARDWMEVTAALGGLLYLFGVYIAGYAAFDASYKIAYSIQAFGVGLLLLPRVVRITHAALQDEE